MLNLKKLAQMAQGDVGELVDEALAALGQDRRSVQALWNRLHEGLARLERIEAALSRQPGDPEPSDVGAPLRGGR